MNFFVTSLNFVPPKNAIRLVVPAAEAKSGPPLAPILGQHQINLMEFCKEFNKVTSVLKPGIPVPLFLIKEKGNKFIIYYRFPSLNFFLVQLLYSPEINGDLKRLSPALLYDILMLRSPYMTNNLKADARTLFGYLSSKFSA